MQQLLKDVKNLADHCHNFKGREKLQLADLISDSREVSAGAVFYAKKGIHVDARRFIPQALAAGAAAVALDYGCDDAETLKLCGEVPVLVWGKEADIGEIASAFYDHPSRKMRLLGVTGTNGKTTTTFIIAQLLELQHKKCLILGTLGWGFFGALHKSANTTLEPVELQRRLAWGVEQGARYAVMEVSSIGVEEGRINGCTFTAACFTNLTRDHLDYHKTMENYANAKLKFLQRLDQSMVCINADDEYGMSFLNKLPEAAYFGGDKKVNCITERRGLFYSNARFDAHGSHFLVHSGLGCDEVSLPLYGSFNVENYMAAVGTLHLLALPLPSMYQDAVRLQPVTGRMERFVGSDGTTMIVDYAHTPDGVEQALKAARQHMSTDGMLIAVLGCGGDRDAGKRPLMALKAVVNADFVIFTSDNPRSEDPQGIIDEMLLGASGEPSKTEVELDRKKAIAKACELARKHPGAVAAILGKGHEDYQIFKDRTIHFSDREEVCTLLQLPAPAPLYQAEPEGAAAKSAAETADSAKAEKAEADKNKSADKEGEDK